ncbi:MAG: hypothetical protein JXQ90_18450 [Cyclobacteriaceae bacterium]
MIDLEPLEEYYDEYLQPVDDEDEFFSKKSRRRVRRFGKRAIRGKTMLTPGVNLIYKGKKAAKSKAFRKTRRWVGKNTRNGLLALSPAHRALALAQMAKEKKAKKKKKATSSSSQVKPRTQVDALSETPKKPASETQARETTTKKPGSRRAAKNAPSQSKAKMEEHIAATKHQSETPAKEGTIEEKNLLLSTKGLIAMGVLLGGGLVVYMVVSNKNSQ